MSISVGRYTFDTLEIEEGIASTSGEPKVTITKYTAGAPASGTADTAEFVDAVPAKLTLSDGTTWSGVSGVWTELLVADNDEFFDAKEKEEKEEEFGGRRSRRRRSRRHGGSRKKRRGGSRKKRKGSKRR